MDDDTGRHDEIRQIHAPGRHSSKREPASWKDMFFPEVGRLNGS